MKIVILSDGFPPNSLGGAEVIASNLSLALLKKGHEVSVITTVRDSKQAGFFIRNGLSTYNIYSSYPIYLRAYKCLNNPRVVKEVAEILKKIKPDVVHAHNIHEHLSYASLAKARKYARAVFLTAHDVMSVHYGKLGSHVSQDGKVVTDSISPWRQLLQYKLRYNPLRNIFIRFYLKKADVIFSVSNALADVLRNKGISKIEVLHNGIDVSNWNINEDKINLFKQKYNLQDKKVLFFGGRLSEAKGASQAVKVLAEVSRELKNVRLLIVGDKSKVGDSILMEIKRLKLEDRVVFTGWVEHKELPYVYGACDLVLVLSKYLDPFPTVNLEAMASKKAVIGTVLGGTPEVVSDGVTGYVVNPRDLKSTSKKVLDLLKDEEKSKSFGLAGFERVTKIFSEDFWVNEMLSRYDTIIQ